MTGEVVRVGVDVTPLAGAPTGIARFVRAMIEDPARDRRIDLSGYVLSARADPVALDVPVRRCPIPASVAHRLWARVAWPSTALVAGSVDVVHATNYVAPPGPALVSVHDVGPIVHPELSSPAVARFGRLVERAVARGAWVHALSHHVAAMLVDRFPVLSERLVVVHLGLDPVRAVPTGAGTRLVGADRYVLALGATEARKNLPALVRSFAATAPVGARLVVAGPTGGAEHDLMSAVGDSGLGERFVRLGEVDEATRAALIRGATVLAYPSLDEGFGFPPLEALSVGVPVVATATGVLPELLGDAMPLPAPGDEPALASLLGDLLRTDQPVPESARAAVATLDWDSTRAQIRDTLVRVAES